MVLNLGSYCTFNRVIRKFFKTVPLIESLFYVVNSSKIQKYDLFSMRSYCTFNRVILKNVQTVRLIETWLIIETIEYTWKRVVIHKENTVPFDLIVPVTNSKWYDMDKIRSDIFPSLDTKKMKIVRLLFICVNNNGLLA